MFIIHLVEVGSRDIRGPQVEDRETARVALPEKVLMEVVRR